MEQILSTGIDIGTTTTHLIVSRLTIEVKHSYGMPPKVEVTKKEILYLSEIFFTPLESDGRISAPKVRSLIEQEYEKAGIKPDELKSGAVIITGESARLRNAKELLYEVSGYAGDFIVAEAGGDTESILAGKGIGASKRSRDERKRVISVDIGGGTTNIAVFEDGEATDARCINIGGRLIRGHWKKRGFHVEACSPYLAPMRDKYDITAKSDDILSEKEIRSVCGHLAKEVTDTLDELGEADLYLFSGGVAACMQAQKKQEEAYDSKTQSDLYGDIGILLGQAICSSDWYQMHNCEIAKMPIRATVIGAGNYSVEISGSTIACLHIDLPVQNIPCEKIQLTCSEDLERAFYLLPERLARHPEKKPVAISFDGWRGIHFSDLTIIAKKLHDALAEQTKLQKPVIILIKEDIGKALGVCLQQQFPAGYPILCVDCVNTTDHDYVDIGKPLGGGLAVPISIKQLVFSV